MNFDLNAWFENSSGEIIDADLRNCNFVELDNFVIENVSIEIYSKSWIRTTYGAKLTIVRKKDYRTKNVWVRFTSRDPGYYFSKEGTLKFPVLNKIRKSIEIVLKDIQQLKTKGESEILKSSEENKKALLEAYQKAKDQGIDLDPSKYTNISDYLTDLEKLKKTNQETINTLKVTPEEHAAAIARLQQIQKELEERKKLAQQLEQQNIFAELEQQKHDLEITNKLISKKADEVRDAENDGDMVKARKLNAEYNELRRKQSAILAFIENLHQNAEYNTFIRFTSLDELYSPDYQWTTDNQIVVEPYQETTWDKTKPYLLWGLGITGILLLVYLVYKYWIKKYVFE